MDVSALRAASMRHTRRTLASSAIRSSCVSASAGSICARSRLAPRSFAARRCSLSHSLREAAMLRTSGSLLRHWTVSARVSTTVRSSYTGPTSLSHTARQAGASAKRSQAAINATCASIRPWKSLMITSVSRAIAALSEARKGIEASAAIRARRLSRSARAASRRALRPRS